MNWGRNLSDLKVTPCEPGTMPWEVDLHIPEAVRKNKQTRTKWILSSATDHYVYSAIDGVIESQRVSKRKADSEGNPPLRITAIVADYDVKLGDEELERGVDRAKYKPQFIERTLSGNFRVVWQLPEPVMVPSYKVCVSILKMFVEKIGMEGIWGGLDKQAVTAPTRRWTNSGEWAALDFEVIPKSTVDGWIAGVLANVNWRSSDFGTEMPMDKVADALREKYPTFADWPGDFVDNSQGPTFWIPESTSPKSAIAHPTGIYTFSAHASKPFYSWRDLLGADFVEDNEGQLIAQAIKGVYHDGRTYWWQAETGNNVWKTATVEDIRRHLKSEGVTAQSENNELSPMDKALKMIQKFQHIDAAVPVIHTTDRIVDMGEDRFLNTYRGKPVSPVDSASKKDFPFIWDFVSNLFCSEEECSVFLDWMQHAYLCFHNKVPSRGQVLIIAGAPNTGKTFLGRYIVGGLLGGFADASRFITTSSSFNEDLFERPVWCIDDSYMTTDSRAHRRTSEQLKSLAANNEFRVEGKFKKAGTVRWFGRVVMTINNDALSIQALPNMDISIKDKLVVLQTAEQANTRFLKAENKLIKLSAELPYFGRWLLDKTKPTVTDARYGIPSYANESIMGHANQSSRFSLIVDMVDMWKNAYFKMHPETECWTGSVLELFSCMKNYLVAFERDFSIGQLRVGLNWMESQGMVERVEVEPNKFSWTICKD